MRRIAGAAAIGLAVLSVLAPASAEAELYPGPHGLREVRGAIEAEWLRMGSARWMLGHPTTHETPTPRRVGAFNHFEHGSIYWSPATGAHEIRGAIRQRWASLGWENSPLGFPTTNEVVAPDGHGRFNHFEGGSIYWSPATGAHEVRGAIRQRWASLGWENSALGYPTTDERGTPDGRGRFNHFQRGSIYWSPATGAQEVRGAIREAWASLGWEKSLLGYPVSDEYAVPGGRRSDFQRGSLVHTSTDGVALDMVLTGSGDAVLPLLPRMSAAQVSFTGSGDALVETVAPRWGTTGHWVAEGAGTWRTTVLLNQGGQAANGLRITTAGDWTVRLMPISGLPAVGSGQVAEGIEGSVVRYTGPPGQVRFESAAPGAYIRIFERNGTYVDELWSRGDVAHWPSGRGVLFEVRQVGVPWSLVVQPY